MRRVPFRFSAWNIPGATVSTGTREAVRGRPRGRNSREQVSFITSVLARVGLRRSLRIGIRLRTAAGSAPTGPAADGPHLPPPIGSVKPVRRDDARRLPAEQSPETLADDLGLPVTADLAAAVTTIGSAERLTGDLRFKAPLLIEGRVEGRLLVMEHGVVVARHARVRADILAEAVTVRGTVKGNLTAVRRIRIAYSGSVEGDVAAPEVVIEDGAWMQGRVDPQRMATTIALARHRPGKAVGQSGPTP